MEVVKDKDLWRRTSTTASTTVLTTVLTTGRKFTEKVEEYLNRTRRTSTTVLPVTGRQAGRQAGTGC